MKKLLSFLLVFCLVLVCTSAALAAPKISKQPESATTDEKGTVSFSIKASGAKGITWRFLNPETGEELTGRTLNSVFRKIRVSGPNGSTITLRNVPEEMHGWFVYCHLSGNGFTDSERVRLLVYGMPDPDAPDQPSETPEPVEIEVVSEPEPSETAAPVETEIVSGPEPSETAAPVETEIVSGPEASETPAPVETEAVTEPVPSETPESSAEPQPSEVPEPSAEPEPETHIDENGNLVEGPPEEVRIVRVFAKDATLYPVDGYGRLVEDGAAQELTFEGSGNLAVRANGEIRYWLINGIRIDPEESVSGFMLRDVATDLIITAVLSNRSAQAIDESKLVSVTCEGCRFTWSKGDIKNAVSGQVPAGAEILIIANPAPESGYSLNGAPFENAGKMSFRITVTEDTVIKAE